MMGVLMRVRIQRLAFCGSVMAALAGCGGGGGGVKVVVAEPDALPFVQAKLVMAGKDVEDAIVTFHAEGGQAQEIISTYDSENDTYRFLTKADGKKKAGVPEGEYRVTVKPGTKSPIQIPAKYADPKTSGLTAKIEKGQNFLPPFELSL